MIDAKTKDAPAEEQKEVAALKAVDKEYQAIRADIIAQTASFDGVQKKLEELKKNPEYASNHGSMSSCITRSSTATFSRRPIS